MDFCCAFLRYFVVQKIGTGTHRGLPSADRRAGKVQSSFPSSTLLRNSQISVRHSTLVFNPISPACRQTGLPAAGLPTVGRQVSFFFLSQRRQEIAICLSTGNLGSCFLPLASCLPTAILFLKVLGTLYLVLGTNFNIECPTPSEECRKCDN